MRRFSITPVAHHTIPSLEAWLKARCTSLAREHDIAFEFDFSTGSQSASYCQTLLCTLEDILEKAALASPPGSTVDIGTYWTRRGLEVEVSISTDCSESGSVGAFRRESTILGNGSSLSVYRARCPQGGTAWIIVQSHFARLRMVA